MVLALLAVLVVASLVVAFNALEDAKVARREVERVKEYVLAKESPTAANSSSATAGRSAPQ